MHLWNNEIIFHVQCRWWCFLCSFWSNKGQIFKSIAQAWHRNEAPKSAFWFGSSTYRLHRYRCHIGTGFRYPTLVICVIYTSIMRLQRFPYIDLFVAPATISKLTATNRFSKRLWLRWISTSTARFKIETRCECFYITVFLKETDCLQKILDVIFISSCM